MHRLLIAPLSAALVALVPAPAFAFLPSTNASIRALQWVHTQQRPDGSIAGDPSRTEDVVLGLVASGYTIQSFATGGNNPLTYLAANIANEEAAAGNTASLILAISASGQDPHHFANHDLLVDLRPTYGATLPGEYGDGIFGDALAVLAVRAAGGAVPPAAIQFLQDHQGKDGGWSFDTAGTFGTDTNTTAVVLMALAPPDAAVLKAALAYLKSQQQLDGGYEFQTTTPPFNVSDPNSDGLVIQGLLAVGQDPIGRDWSLNGKNALTNLLSFQACDGSLSFPGIGPDNLLATTQPLVALASAHLPVASAPPTRGNALTAQASAPPACAAATATTLPQTGSPPVGPILLLIAGIGVLVVAGRLVLRRE